MGNWKDWEEIREWISMQDVESFLADENEIKAYVQKKVEDKEWAESCRSKIDEYYKERKANIKDQEEESQKKEIEKFTTDILAKAKEAKSIEELKKIVKESEDEKRKIMHKEDTCVFITNAALAPELEKEKKQCVIAVNENQTEDTLKDKLKEKLGDDVQKVPFNTILIFDDVKDKGTVEIITKVLKDLGKEYISYPAELYKKRKETKRDVILIEDQADKKDKTDQTDGLAKIARCLEDIERRLDYTKDSTHMDKYLETLENSANDPAIKTGFNNFDEALGGGLRAGRLYGIGAIASLGKTTFALQIADNIARTGQDVLIFSLEMSRQELFNKSISRGTAIISSKKQVEAYKDNGNVYLAKDNKAITSHFISSSLAALPEEKRKFFHEAIDDYDNNIAPHRRIIEGVGDIGVKHIKELVENFCLIKRSRPVVIIDYLQILAPYSDKMTDKQNIDKNILELKRLCRDYQVPIIAINSFNRGNYLTAASFESFKESGAIEYSCDVLIALQLGIEGKGDWEEGKESNKKRQQINEAKMKNPRDIEVIILKNRGYKAYAKIDFEYYQQFDFFEEKGISQEMAGIERRNREKPSNIVPIENIKPI